MKLQDIWYKKLSNSGFNGSETYINKKGLRSPSSFIYPESRQISYKIDLNVRNHYLYCTFFTNHAKFSSKLHSLIWSLYCQGISYRKMIPIIKKKGYKTIPSIFLIHKRVHETLADMAWFHKCEALKNSEPEETLENFIESNETIQDL